MTHRTPIEQSLFRCQEGFDRMLGEEKDVNRNPIFCGRVRIHYIWDKGYIVISMYDYVWDEEW